MRRKWSLILLCLLSAACVHAQTAVPYLATGDRFGVFRAGVFIPLEKHRPLATWPMGDRLAYLGGLPTAEVYAAAYKALGTPVYSSAVFNFIPKTAMRFYNAVKTDDHATQHQLLKDFFMPYLKIRNKSEGYAVSIVKAGAKIVGHDAGPVRAPLADLKPDEVEALAALIKKVEQ